MTKSEARAYVKPLRNALSAKEVHDRSEIIMDSVCRLDEFKKSDNILVYVDYNNEVETKNFIEYCIRLGKSVYVPKVYGGTLMKFHKIDSLALLNSGKYGILEPVNEYCDNWDDIKGLMVMPGLAFGRDFGRVGYGKGFYDRYLSAHNGIYTVAVCFDFQLIDKIDIDDYDYRPDVIVTDSEVIFNGV